MLTVVGPPPAGRQDRPAGKGDRGATVLNQIYEVDFLGLSYGFLVRKVNGILDADIAGFFDSLSQECLMDFLKLRIADRRLLRLIGKWLRAGILEDGRLTVPEPGTPP